jgi:PPOX class probable F420-dependent enzyme
MPLDIDDDTQAFISSHRVGRLATAGEDRQPAVIPICYVFDGEHIYSPIDEKPKSVAASSLKRVRNIEANPQVALVIDDYSEDWSKLAYVLIAGTAEMVLPNKEADTEAGNEASKEAQEHASAVRLLREKYPQYRSMKIDERPMIKIRPARIKRWGVR